MRSDSRALKAKRQARLAELPRGPHRLPREAIADNQRRRLIAAMAEASAERDYANTSVAHVIEHAAVSRTAFYAQFADLRECMLAAFDELFERLLAAVDHGCAEARDWEARVAAAVAAALAFLAADPPVARLLTVEILAAGSEATARCYAAIETLAVRLREGRAGGDRATSLPPTTEWGLVATMALLIAKRLVDAGAERLADLQGELVELALAPHVGAGPPAAARPESL